MFSASLRPIGIRLDHRFSSSQAYSPDVHPVCVVFWMETVIVTDVVGPCPTYSYAANPCNVKQLHKLEVFDIYDFCETATLCFED